VAAPPPIGLAPFTLSICGIGELGAHCEASATHVVSILDPGAPEPAAFSSFAAHDRLELRFHDAIEPSHGYVLPQPRDVAALLAFGHGIGVGSHVLIHCHAGQSRSTAMAALLLAQARPDVSAARIFAAVAGLRPRAWPNLRIVEIGDGLLGSVDSYRNHRMIAARVMTAR